MAGTKRRTKQRDFKPQLNEQVVRLFMKCEEIVSAGDDEFWDDEGGRRDELREAGNELDRLLGRPPWSESLTYTTEADPPSSMRNAEQREQWAIAYELRQQLLTAAVELEKRDAEMLAAVMAKKKKQK